MTRLISALAGLLLATTSMAQPSSSGPLAPPANGPRHADSTFVAIVDCTAHPTPGASTDHATVVFRDGRVVNVLAPEGKGPNAPSAPAGARVIEGKGLHVYPGFIDAYVDVDAPAPEGDPAALHWCRKVTPQRTALEGAGVDAPTAEALRRLGFATACISPRGGVFRGNAAVVSLAKMPEEQSAAKPPVYREKAYQSVAFEMGGGYPGSEMGAIALIRQTFIDADWQKAAREAGEVIAPNCLDSLDPEEWRRTAGAIIAEPAQHAWRAPAHPDLLYGPFASAASATTIQPAWRWDLGRMSWFDMSGWNLDHMPRMNVRDWNFDQGILVKDYGEPQDHRGAWRDRGQARVDLGVFAPEYKPFVLFNTDDELEALRAAKVLKEFKRAGVILGCGTEFSRLDAIKATGTDFVLPLNFPKTPDVSTYAKAEGVELKELMTWEQGPTNPRRMAGAGIKFALTTGKLANRADFAGNLKTALKYGLTEQQAIAALTTVPAEMLGVADQVGTIESGKRANLIVADGPIFGEKTKIRTVFIDGQPHEITPTPVDLEGTWAMEIPGAAAAERKLVIDKDNGITVHRNDKSVKAQKVAVENGKVSFAFDHEPLDGTSGVYVATGIIEKVDGKPARLSGQGLRANGEMFSWTATRGEQTLTGSWPLKGEGGAWEGGVLVFDEKNGLTLAGMPDLKTEDYSYDKGHVKFRAGEDAVDATVDLEASPPQMKGTVNGKTAFVAKRAERTPRARLVGSWVPSAAGEAKTELVFDEAGRGVIIVDDKQAKLDDVKIETGKVTFSVDGKSLGKEGVVKYDLKLDRPLVAAPTMAGTTKDEEGGEKEFTVQRRATPTPVGKWRITETDGKPVDPAQARGVTLDINTRGITVTVTRAEGPVVVKSDDVRFNGEKASFTHDLEKLGGTGKASDEVTVATVDGKAVMTGVGKYQDGTSHAYKAVKVVDEPVQVAAGLTMTQDEAERIKQVPEKLPLPFGPYGLFERPEPQFVVFKNATVWTCAKDGVLPRADVVIMDGKIVGFGAGVDLSKISSGGRKPTVVDCQGKAITPGIIDCHSHTGISRGVNEGGQAVTAEVRIADVTDPDTVDWYRQLAGGVTAVNSLHGSANAIGGQSQTNKLRWGCAAPDDMHFEGAKPGIKFALGENPRQVNFGGGGRRGQGGDAPPARYPSSRMGVETLIRDRFTAAEEYNRARSGAASVDHVDERTDAVRTSLAQTNADLAKVDKSIEQLDGELAGLKKEKKPQKAQIDSAEKARTQFVEQRASIEKVRGDLSSRLAQLTRTKGGTPASSAVPLRRDLELEAIGEILTGQRLVHCHSYRQDEILMLCQVARDFGFKIGTFQHALEGYKVADYIRDTTWGGASGFADWWAYKVEVQDAIPAAFPIMHDVGANVSFNSDSNELARRLNVDAAKAVKYGGLTEEEALKFVTLNPAKQLQIDKRVGTIEPGKDADLVIWSGDPLSSLSRCEATYVDGRCLFSLDQDQEHRKRISSERQRLIQKILNEGRPKRDEGDSAEGDSGPRRGGFGPPGGFGGRRRGQRPPQDE